MYSHQMLDLACKHTRHDARLHAGLPWCGPHQDEPMSPCLVANLLSMAQHACSARSTEHAGRGGAQGAEAAEGAGGGGAGEGAGGTGSVRGAWRCDQGAARLLCSLLCCYEPLTAVFAQCMYFVNRGRGWRPSAACVANACGRINADLLCLQSRRGIPGCCAAATRLCACSPPHSAGWRNRGQRPEPRSPG